MTSNPRATARLSLRFLSYRGVDAGDENRRPVVIAMQHSSLMHLVQAFGNLAGHLHQSCRGSGARSSTSLRLSPETSSMAMKGEPSDSRWWRYWDGSAAKRRVLRSPAVYGRPGYSRLARQNLERRIALQ